MSYDPGAESSVAFRACLQHFGLSLLDVASAAHVRPMTVGNIGRGLPVRAEHALAVRAGLSRLTGVPYTALIPTIPVGILLLAQPSQREEKP